MGLCSFEPARVRALGPPAGRIPPPPTRRCEGDLRPRHSLGCQRFLTEAAPHRGVCSSSFASERSVFGQMAQAALRRAVCPEAVRVLVFNLGPGLYQEHSPGGCRAGVCDGVIDGDRQDPPETRGSLAVAPEGRRRGGATLQESRPGRCGPKKEGGQLATLGQGLGTLFFVFLFFLFLLLTIVTC